jgi:hypothetical protein
LVRVKAMMITIDAADTPAPGSGKNKILSQTGAPEQEQVEKNRRFISLARWLTMGLLEVRKRAGRIVRPPLYR